MSQETLTHLNLYTLIGFTDKRGNAWHYREDMQGEEDNHYPGAIPVEDVIRRLFNFKVVELPFYINPTGDGAYIEVPGRKVMARDDNFVVFGAFKEGYQGHDYEEWLLDNWGHILDTSKGDLGIGSAGLLRNGAQAWVSIEVPENITTKEGVEFRPHFLSYSSFDGSLSTGYKGVSTFVVCDNTFRIAREEKGKAYRLRHTKYSNLRIGEAREALGIIFQMSEEFENEIARLSKWKVSDTQFDKLLDVVIPLPEEPEKNKRGFTVAEKKREEIMALYRNDERAAPWNGTALGVVQAFNTWNHHFAQVRGEAPRFMRVMENVLSDKFQNADSKILEALASV